MIYYTTALRLFVKLCVQLTVVLVFGGWVCDFQICFAETTSNQGAASGNSVNSNSLPERNLTEKGSLNTIPLAKLKPRKFVREWKVKDLRRELHQLGEGRSYSMGKKLFTAATCAKCHQINKAGGTHGPDLTGVAGRNSRVVILQEIIEPSKKNPQRIPAATSRYLIWQIVCRFSDSARCEFNLPVQRPGEP